MWWHCPKIRTYTFVLSLRKAHNDRYTASNSKYFICWTCSSQAHCHPVSIAPQNAASAGTSRDIRIDTDIWRTVTDWVIRTTVYVCLYILNAHWGQHTSGMKITTCQFDSRGFVIVKETLSSGPYITPGKLATSFPTNAASCCIMSSANWRTALYICAIQSALSAVSDTDISSECSPGV